MKVSVADAKNKLPELIKAVENGETVTIYVHSKEPVPAGPRLPSPNRVPQADWQVTGAFPEELFDSEYVYYCGRTIG